MSLPFIPKFKYKDIIYNNTTQEVRIVMHACVQNKEPGYCVDYLNGECAWIDLSDENNWNKIGEVTSDVKPWIKNDNNILKITEVCVLN